MDFVLEFVDDSKYYNLLFIIECNVISNNRDKIVIFEVEL